MFQVRIAEVSANLKKFRFDFVCGNERNYFISLVNIISDDSDINDYNELNDEDTSLEYLCKERRVDITMGFVYKGYKKKPKYVSFHKLTDDIPGYTHASLKKKNVFRKSKK